MRTHGTLKKWNDDRGFGFISLAEGGKEVFVHISEFPKDGVRPRINEVISFETQTGSNGKLQAVRVMRPGQRLELRRPRAKGRQNQSTGILGTVFSFLAIAVIAYYAYSRFVSAPAAPSVPQGDIAALSANSSVKCDGRTRCSQMTSCAEARYFLKHCPNTKMDGNNDGEPCEEQWCN